MTAGFYRYYNFQVSRSEAPVFSHAYLNTKTFFQLVGCASVPAFSLLYFMVYCFSKCKEPFTYYQAEYAQIYRSTENGVFEKKMKEKVGIYKYVGLHFKRY